MGKVKHKRHRQKGFDPTGLLTVDSSMSMTDTMSACGGDADSSPQSGTVAKLVEKVGLNYCLKLNI